MTDIRMGDQIRLTTYEGHVGFGTPESHAVHVTRHEGTVLGSGGSRRWGQSVRLECSIKHEDPEEDEVLYLSDFDVHRVNVETCPQCAGRGHVVTALDRAVPAMADTVARPTPAPTSADASKLVRELTACADYYADATRGGKLLELADFTRHRIAKALRDAATALGGVGAAAPTTRGLALIGAERGRQIREKRHNPAGDLGRSSELMAAAECYLLVAHHGPDGWHNPDGSYAPPGGWPWGESAWHPNDDREENLAIAGALIAAAIDALTAAPEVRQS